MEYAESGLLKVAFRPLEAYKELYLYLLTGVWTVIFMRVNITSPPSNTVQVLPTTNKLLKHDIVIEANSGGLPEGSEMATDDDIDGLIDDVFGTGVNPDPDEPTYSPDDIATEKELNDAITDVFG